MIGFMLTPIFFYIIGVAVLSNPGRDFYITDFFAYLFSFLISIVIICYLKLYKFIELYRPTMNYILFYTLLALVYSLSFVLIKRYGSFESEGIRKAFSYINILIVAPIFEEIVFRGIPIEYFKKYNVRESYILILTSLFFGLSHMPSLLLAHTFVLGLILSLVYLRDRNIFYCILIHFCFNLFNEVLKL